jgi:hypothetical protein
MFLQEFCDRSFGIAITPCFFTIVDGVVDLLHHRRRVSDADISSAAYIVELICVIN